MGRWSALLAPQLLDAVALPGTEVRRRRRVRYRPPRGRRGRALARVPGARRRPVPVLRGGRRRATGRHLRDSPGGRRDGPAGRGRLRRCRARLPRAELRARTRSRGVGDVAGHACGRRGGGIRVGLRGWHGHAAHLLGCRRPPRPARAASGRRHHPAVALGRPGRGCGERLVSSTSSRESSPCSRPSRRSRTTGSPSSSGPARPAPTSPGCSDAGRAALRADLEGHLGQGPFELTARARWVRGTVPG